MIDQSAIRNPQSKITGPEPAAFLVALGFGIGAAYFLPRQWGIKVLALTLVVTMILHRQQVEELFSAVQQIGQGGKAV